MKQTTAKSETNKEYIKKELRKLFRSMDFVSKKFLSDERAAGKRGLPAIGYMALSFRDGKSSHMIPLKYDTDITIVSESDEEGQQ